MILHHALRPCSAATCASSVIAHKWVTQQVRHVSRNSAINRGLRAGDRRAPSTDYASGREDVRQRLSGSSRSDRDGRIPSRRPDSGASRGRFDEDFPRSRDNFRSDRREAPGSSYDDTSSRMRERSGHDREARTSRRSYDETSRRPANDDRFGRDYQPDRRIARDSARVETRRERSYEPRERAYDRDRRDFSDRSSSDRPDRTSRYPDHEARSTRYDDRPVREDSERTGFRSRYGEDSYSDKLSDDSKVPFSIPYTTAASTFLTGTRAASAALFAGRRKLYKLYLSRQSSSMETLRRKAVAVDIPVEIVSPGYLDQLSAKLGKKGEDLIHDGVILEASPLPQKPILAVGEASESTFALTYAPMSREEAAISGTDSTLPISCPPSQLRPPFVLWLHGIVDTRNLGAIARTALYFDIDALLLTSRGTASPSNASALRASAGALEYIPILNVPQTIDPHTFITSSQQNGWQFISAVAPPVWNEPASTHPPHAFLHDLEVNLARQKPTVLVLGNEDLGLAPQFVKKTDARVSVGGGGKRAREARVDSLNVGVAGGILLEWFVGRGTRRRRNRDGARRDGEETKDESELQNREERLF